MNDHPRPLITRHELSVTDPDRAEQYIRENYVRNSTLTITGRAADFTFRESTVIAPGFSINRPQIGVHITDDAVTGPDDGITVVAPTGNGRIAYVDTRYPLDVHAVPGDVVLFPPTGPFHVIGAPMDGLMVQLDRPALADYAAATTGLAPRDLSFEGLAPIDPTLGRHWNDTVAHVRDHVLADPWAAASPLLLDQAFRLLAAALLSTFPNTALARATDPDTPAPRGDVPTATLDEVVDYLDTHAADPIGPTELTDLTGIPFHEIVEGLRRRDKPHPAEQLWTARLHGVRRALLDADPGTATGIPELAARWGFARPRQFRTAYTAAFGEPPDDTLRR